MRHRVSAQTRLRERFRQLYKSDHNSFAHNVRYFLQWAESIPVVAGLLGVIRRSEPDLDPQQWRSTAVSRHEVLWPATEVGRSKVVLWMLEQVAVNPQDSWHVAMDFSHETNFDAALRDFNDVVVEPFIDYLDERLAAETDLLYVFERYRRRVLWFEQDRLWAIYSEDTARGEKAYDGDLRQFLFEQGVDFPFSQVRSPSGEADITLVDESDKPLPLEVKLFDGDRYGRAYLAQGVGQAFRYAEDYNQSEGYLVVFNLSPISLELPTDDPDAGRPPRLHIDGRVVFIVVVQAAPRATASAAGKQRVYKVSRTDLVG